MLLPLAGAALSPPEMAKNANDINPNISTAQVKYAGHNIRRENLADYLIVDREFIAEH